MTGGYMKVGASSILVLALLATTPAHPAARDARGGVAALSGTLHISDASIAVQCPLTVGGSFDAKSGALTGNLVLDADQQGAVEGELVVDLRTLQTGIALRDNHMRDKYLEVQRGDSFATATLGRIRLEGVDPTNLLGKATFRGVLTLHGQEREVAGTADILRSDRGVRVQAAFPLKVSDFDIASPTYLGVGVRNEVKVTVNFKVGPKPLL
jgi:polyisoprenoid-binding protein YceI